MEKARGMLIYIPQFSHFAQAGIDIHIHPYYTYKWKFCITEKERREMRTEIETLVGDFKTVNLRGI